MRSVDDTERAIETASAIARLQVSVEGVEGKVERIVGAVERIEAAVTGHGFAIQQLQAAEARRTGARTAAVKWVAGVVAGVAVAALVMVLGLGR